MVDDNKPEVDAFWSDMHGEILVKVGKHTMTLDEAEEFLDDLGKVVESARGED